MKRKSLFITFEGTEGAGKSSLIAALSVKLQELGISHIKTREPGGSPLSEKIRELILHQSMSPITEVFLYQASRAEHIKDTIQPALQKKQWVLCDRFTDSSLAYQAFARGLDWKKIKLLNEYAIQGVKPDLKIFIDIDPEMGLKRAKDINRFEKEGLEFQKKVKKGFLKSMKEDPKRWIVLKPGHRSPPELAEEVLRLIQKKKKGALHE